MADQPDPQHEHGADPGNDLTSPLGSWIAHEDESRITKTVAEQSSFTVKWRIGAPRPGTSMLQSGHSSGTPCGHNSLPGFTTTGSATTTPSVVTAIGERNLPSQALLEEDHQGALQVTPLRGTVEYHCPFDYLRCHKKFADKAKWITHSLEHFGDHGPPKESKCCWCDQKFERATARDNWKDRMDHLSLHFTLRHSLSHARPDFSLHRYLFEKGIINNSFYKELFGPHNRESSSSKSTNLRVPRQAPEPDSEPCITMYNPREERRRQVPAYRSQM